MTKGLRPPIYCGNGHSNTQDLEGVKRKGIHRSPTACPQPS